MRMSSRELGGSQRSVCSPASRRRCVSALVLSRAPAATAKGWRSRPRWPSTAPPPQTQRHCAPTRASRSTARTPEGGEKAKEFSALQYAADKGQSGAQWKIGQMFAEGDGVARNDLRAFEYFSEIANARADEPPGTRAGAHRRQRLRGAGPLLPERHSRQQDQAQHGAGAADVWLCRDLFRRCRRSVRTRPALSRRHAEQSA